VMFEGLGWRGSRVLAVISACWLVLPVCLVLAPGAWLVGCVASGVAQGGYFAALFTIVIRRSVSVDENRETTAFMQTAGYVVAAAGPVVLGWVHEATGAWPVPFVLVVVVLVMMTVFGQVAASRRGTARLDAMALLAQAEAPENGESR
ncbi:MFS transporter, partial [Actinomyces sp. MRS3W]|nr:MFS transporter [Actinomyces sp. MRS3W]